MDARGISVEGRRRKRADSGFGVSSNFIQVDGKVLYSPMLDSYRDYLMLRNDWYAKGYISPDFMSDIPPWYDLAKSSEEAYGVFDIS